MLILLSACRESPDRQVTLQIPEVTVEEVTKEFTAIPIIAAGRLGTRDEMKLKSKILFILPCQGC
jgi:hypothetical protein